MHRLAFFASLLPMVASHGFIASPPARRPGNAYKAACGEQPFYQQSSDINGNVQGIQQVLGKDQTDACNLWLCKGFLLDDNKDKVQSFSLGQTIDFQITISAPHTGYANVSVVKTNTNTMIGNPLIEFDNYASNAGLSPNNTAFSVTLPNSLGGECTAPGDCVLQWFWDAPDIDQTYEACVDFTVADDGSAPAPTPSASTYSVPAPTSTAIVATSTSVVGAEPIPTTSPVPDEDECPTDVGEDEGEDVADDEGDEDCPADTDEGEGDEIDEECPVDGGEEDEDGEDSSPIEDGECPAEDEAAQ
ncbi:hypothetical protein VTI28DRAFT_4126 [Corynascus sepedonium]